MVFDLDLSSCRSSQFIIESPEKNKEFMVLTWNLTVSLDPTQTVRLKFPGKQENATDPAKTF